MKQLEKYLHLILILPLFLYVYISFYCQPIADDFTFSVILRHTSLWDAGLSLYQGTTGRYFSNFLMAINPMAFNKLWLYKTIPILVICLTFFAIYQFIKQLTNKVYSRNNYLISSTVLLLLYLVYMPNIAQGIYWYTGYSTYHLSLIFTLFYFISLIKLFSNSKNRFWLQLLSIILLFICIGFNEVIMVVLTLLLLIIALMHYNQNKNLNWIFVHVLFASIFSLIVIFAPGTSARGGHYANHHNLIESLIMSTFQTCRFFTEWISASLLIISLIFVFVNKQLSNSISLFRNSFYLKPVASLLLLLSVIFIASFLPYWSTGILGQHRTMNLAYFIFIFLWFINLNVWYNWINIESNIPLNPKILNACLVFLFLLMLFTHNSYTILEDTFYRRHKIYNKQMNERITQITDAKTDSIFLPILKTKPKSLFILDISQNSNDWVNQGYLIYLDKKGKILIGIK